MQTAPSSPTFWYPGLHLNETDSPYPNDVTSNGIPFTGTEGASHLTVEK